MSRTVVIAVEGVLQSPTNDSPIPTGILLYHGLKATFNIALVFDGKDEEKLKYWTDLHGFTEHSYVFPAIVTDFDYLPGDKRLAQMGRIRRAGCSIDLVIEPDPLVAARLLKAGFTVLNFLSPLYSRPEYRPDYEGNKPRAWDSLIAESKQQEDLRVADTRLSGINE